MGVGSWVVTWVDYTSKYGLGYMLSDGCVGVYFNDSTKIVLASDGVHFEYVERSSSTATAAQRRVIVRARHTLDSFPKAITKKVTLLNHFKGYLVRRVAGEACVVGHKPLTHLCVCCVHSWTSSRLAMQLPALKSLPAWRAAA